MTNDDRAALHFEFPELEQWRAALSKYETGQLVLPDLTLAASYSEGALAGYVFNASLKLTCPNSGGHVLGKLLAIGGYSVALLSGDAGDDSAASVQASEPGSLWVEDTNRFGWRCVKCQRAKTRGNKRGTLLTSEVLKTMAASVAYGQRTVNKPERWGAAIPVRGWWPKPAKIERATVGASSRILKHYRNELIQNRPGDAGLYVALALGLHLLGVGEPPATYNPAVLDLLELFPEVELVGGSGYVLKRV